MIETAWSLKECLKFVALGYRWITPNGQTVSSSKRQPSDMIPISDYIAKLRSERGSEG